MAAGRHRFPISAAEASPLCLEPANYDIMPKMIDWQPISLLRFLTLSLSLGCSRATINNHSGQKATARVRQLIIFYWTAAATPLAAARGAVNATDSQR